jgi:hypothetical protein
MWLSKVVAINIRTSILLIFNLSFVYIWKRNVFKENYALIILYFVLLETKGKTLAEIKNSLNRTSDSDNKKASNL